MRKSPRKKKNVSYMEFNREEPLSESEEEEDEAEEDLPTPEKKPVKKTGVKAAKTGTTTGKPAGKTTKPTRTTKTTKTTKTAAKTTKGHRDSSPDDSQNSQGRKRQDNWQLLCCYGIAQGCFEEYWKIRKRNTGQKKKSVGGNSRYCNILPFHFKTQCNHVYNGFQLRHYGTL